MSVAAMTWAWAQSTSCSSDKLVLVALADSANDEGACWPGQQTLVRKTGCSPRTVVAVLGRLQAAGLIWRTHRQRADGSRTSDYYVLALAANTQDLQEGQPAKPAGHEPKETPHSDERGASARAAFALNGTMPVDVTETERAVLAAVERIGRAKRAKPAKAAAVVDLCRRFADRDLAGEAERFEHYYTDGRGENVKVRDVVARWRNWIDQAPGKSRGQQPARSLSAGERRMQRHERRREAAMRVMAADAAEHDEGVST